MVWIRGEIIDDYKILEGRNELIKYIRFESHEDIKPGLIIPILKQAIKL
jgi:hypothetical protein